MASKNPFAIFAPSVVSDKIDKYLVVASLEALNAHPACLPSNLICPISHQLMKDPVYTPEGYVYDRAFITKALARDQRDPQNRNKLVVSDLRSFSQLLPHIELFGGRQANYKEEKTKLINKAREIANTKPVHENPALFVCPLNKQLIKNPVITASGKVYDKASLEQFLQKTGNLDETGCKLTLQDVVPFEEFDAQIKVYEFYLSQQQKTEHLSSPGNSTYSLFSFSPFSILNNLFWGKEECDTTIKIY